MSCHSSAITEQDTDDHGVLAGRTWICAAENGFVLLLPIFYHFGKILLITTHVKSNAAILTGSQNKQ